jgi:hypothetical protein
VSWVGVAGFEPAASSSRTVGTVLLMFCWPSVAVVPAVGHRRRRRGGLLYLAAVQLASCWRRRSGARRSLPRCVNQCSLSGPGLRTGEPLTSPLPWCCPHWDDSSSAVSLPLPLVGAMKRSQPMTSVEPGRATLPGCGVVPALVQGRSCRVRVGRWGVKKRGDRSHTRGVRGPEPPRGRFCGCWSPWCSPSPACWSLVMLWVVADARPWETGAGALTRVALAAREAPSESARL